MKVKDSSIANKKKSALPSSKILKPKKFKPLKKSGVVKTVLLSSDEFRALNEGRQIKLSSGQNLFKTEKKRSRKKKALEISLSSPKKTESLHHDSSLKKPESQTKKSKAQNISTLFDFVLSDESNNESEGKVNVKNKVDIKSPETKRMSLKQVKTPLSQKKNQKAKLGKAISDDVLEKQHKLKLLQSPESKNLFINVDQNDKRETTALNTLARGKKRKLLQSPENKSASILRLDRNNKRETAALDKCQLKPSKVEPITKGLLKLIGESSSSKPEILDVGEPVFLQVECIKIPICPTKQLRFKLPHPLVDETCDVLLITADLKGHKIYPDKAVEHYEELLDRLDIKFINKVMPLRMLKQEYSQYETRRKLVDQFDVFLADSRIIKSLPSILGKFALYKRKMPIPVNLSISERKLKKHLKDSVRKTQMTVKSNGHCSVVQVGHSKMAAAEVAANVVAVAQALESCYPGGWRNVRSLTVKSTQSTALPVYMSLLSPNEVRIPVESVRRPLAVEGELSTMPGHRVIVTADGNVILKKVDEERKIDDSKDDEILEEAEKYMESSKTVRYDESSDEEKKDEKEESDSDDEGEAITEAMEKKLLHKYENAKANKRKGEEDDDEEEEEEDDEDNFEEEESMTVPLTKKKRKLPKTTGKSGPPAKKALKPVELKGKNKMDKPSKDKKSASPGLKKPQPRGARGGKKNKLSKDQRKALIKRKKAGKK